MYKGHHFQLALTFGHKRLNTFFHKRTMTKTIFRYLLYVMKPSLSTWLSLIFKLQISSNSNYSYWTCSNNFNRLTIIIVNLHAGEYKDIGWFSLTVSDHIDSAIILQNIKLCCLLECRGCGMKLWSYLNKAFRFAIIFWLIDSKVMVDISKTRDFGKVDLWWFMLGH